MRRAILLASALVALICAVVGAVTCQRSTTSSYASTSALATIEGEYPDTSGYASAVAEYTGGVLCESKEVCAHVDSDASVGEGYCSYVLDRVHVSKSFTPAGSWTQASAKVVCSIYRFYPPPSLSSVTGCSVTAYVTGYCGG